MPRKGRRGEWKGGDGINQASWGVSVWSDKARGKREVFRAVAGGRRDPIGKMGGEDIKEGRVSSLKGNRRGGKGFAGWTGEKVRTERSEGAAKKNNRDKRAQDGKAGGRKGQQGNGTGRHKDRDAEGVEGSEGTSGQLEGTKAGAIRKR